MRNTIEGLNGYAKDPAHQALAQPARRRVRGIAAQSIFTALLLMAANIRKIRAWRALTARDKARITRGHGGAGPACATTSPTADTPAAPTATTDHTSSPAGSHAPDRQNAANRPPALPDQARTRPAPMSDPGAILKNRSPPQFCRYDTGSSVGNPECGRGDSNPHGVATNRT